MRYADPRLCPDCRAALPASLRSCPGCHLPLQNPLALELFQTLQRADVLLGRLRAQVALEAPAPTPAPAPQGPSATPVRRTGLRTASVPAILLGLGALCLLVAAITFLAVAWSWMGVGGRTGVLVGLTVAAAGAGVVLGRRGLRVAAESLTTVALGLVALDVVGAINAGWLGSPDSAASTALVGAGVAVVSGAILVARPRLVAPQLGVVVGLMLAFAGVAVTTGHDRLVAFVAVLALGTAASLGRSGRCPRAARDGRARGRRLVALAPAGRPRGRAHRPEPGRPLDHPERASAARGGRPPARPGRLAPPGPGKLGLRIRSREHRHPASRGAGPRRGAHRHRARPLRRTGHLVGGRGRGLARRGARAAWAGCGARRRLHRRTRRRRGGAGLERRHPVRRDGRRSPGLPHPGHQPSAAGAARRRTPGCGMGGHAAPARQVRRRRAARGRGHGHARVVRRSTGRWSSACWRSPP